MSRLANWIGVALLDLKGDLRRFGVLLACLALGTCTIAAVGSVGAALQDAIVRDATKLMGGDIEISRSDRRATADERAFFETLGGVAEEDDSNGRATAGDNSAFLDIVAVDGDYPLVGSVDSPQLPNGEKPADLLAPRDGVWGAIVNPIILDRLGIGIGGRFSIGATQYEARGTLGSLPDGAARGFHLGLTALISVDALTATPDARPPLPGMLTQYRYKIVLKNLVADNALEAYAAGAKAVADHFNDPQWVTRNPKQAAGDLARYYDVFTEFLLIVGLSALLVGGVGVSNAVSAYIIERQRSIATMRSLGATGSRIMVHFLVQLGILSLIGIVVGVVLGAVSTALALPVLGRILAVDLPPAVYPVALLTAVGFGMLVAFGFSYVPILRAQKLKPAMLFRSVGGAMEQLRWGEIVKPKALLPLLVTAALIYVLALSTTNNLALVNWYTGGVVGAFLLLRLAGFLLQLLLRQIPPLPSTSIRNALKAVYRPGSPAPVVILSLGLGLAMLLLIVLVDNNTRNQLQGEVARDAPTYLATDLFPDEVDELTQIAKTNKDFAKFVPAPMFRGKVLSINGVPSGQIKTTEEGSFLLGGATNKDIPMTWAGDLPAQSTVVAGQWWGKDYSGPPLVSLRSTTVASLGLKIGDKLEFDLYNQKITATLANIRDFQWQSGMNFMVTFSPHALDGLPGSFMGGVYAAPGATIPVGRLLAQQYPDLTFIPIGDALSQAADILDQLSTAVDIVGGLAVINGLLVLAGTMAAGRAQREADAVINKVLGATRGDVIKAFVLEYSILGAFAAAIAAVLGVIGAWAITIYALQVGYGIDIPLIIAVIILTVMLTIATGAATTWGALSTKPAQYLRTE
jgi:putative ABC transport system permease protein